MPRVEEEVPATLTRAFAQRVRAGDVAGAVAIAASPVHAPVGHHMGAARLIQHALELVPPDSLEAGRLLSRYGMVMGMEEADYDGAQEAFGRSMTIAEGLGDAALEMRTLAWAARVDRFHLRYQECLDKSRRAIELSQRPDTNAPFAEAIAHRWAARVLEVTGENLAEAHRHAEATLALAETSRDPARRTSALDISANLYRLEGNWREARAFSDRGLGVEPQSPQLLGGRVLLEYELCSGDDGERFLEDLLEAMDLTPRGPSAEYSVPAGVIPVVARITGGSARLDVAERAARICLQSSPTPAAEMWARAGLAVLAVLQSDRAVSGEQYTALVPQQRTMLSTGVSMAADRLLGLLAQTMRNLEQAMTHFEAALAFCRRAGYQPELAWTCCDYADALLQRNADGDRDRAMSLLDESLTISREFGMCHLAERAQARITPS